MRVIKFFKIIIDEVFVKLVGMWVALNLCTLAFPIMYLFSPWMIEGMPILKALGIFHIVWSCIMYSTLIIRHVIIPAWEESKEVA